MSRITAIPVVALICFLAASAGNTDEYAFNREKSSFENFIRCELTRTNAVNYFNGMEFEITMINFFDIRAESDLKIVTGAVECFAGKTHHTLFVAVGLKKVLEKEKVSYLVIRHTDFDILATELIRYPYKERCPWAQYWIDID